MKSRPTTLLVSLALLVLTGSSLHRQAPTGAAFQRAESAFMQHDFAGAAAAYRAVLDSDSVVAHRREAVVSLASIAWRVQRDTAEAARILDKAAATDWGRFDAELERSRMCRGWSDFGAARRAATAALAVARTRADSDAGNTAWSAAVVAPLVRARLRSTPDSASALLPQAVARLDTIVRGAPGKLEPARLLIEASALALNRPALRDGWRSYYLTGVGDTLHALLAAPRQNLESVSRQPIAAIVRALAQSRLFQAAAVVALLPDSTGAPLAYHDFSAHDVVAYALFLRSVEHATDAYYQRAATGKRSTTRWTADLDSAAAILWTALGEPAPAPGFADDRFASLLDRRFGALINLGTTAGYSDLHMGHRVLDERRSVAQYGHSATLRFVALDAMASNGFESWAWDGRAAHGGWGSDSLIVQVRTSYAEGPLRAWHEITDTAAINRIDRQIAADSIADIAHARATPAGYLPSVAERLRRDGRRDLRDSLARAGYRGAALQAAFERAIGTAELESSIFAHEGRHAIDGTLGITDAAELEYRAKLSEIAFAPEPRLAFGGIMSRNAGDATPHGQANLRVLKGLLGWMESHASRIVGLDRSVPLLPQLPLLSDPQLRRAAASLDPLARETPGTPPS